MTIKAYAVVRQETDSQREWIDLATVSQCWEWTDELARTTDAKIPQWANANPRVRRANITITEEHD